MRNEHRQSAGSGLLLGMAAGAALGAASVVAITLVVVGGLWWYDKKHSYCWDGMMKEG